MYIIYFFLGKCDACKLQRMAVRETKRGKRKPTATCSLFALAAAASQDRKHVLSVNILNIISVYYTIDRAILGLWKSCNLLVCCLRNWMFNSAVTLFPSWINSLCDFLAVRITVWNWHHSDTTSRILLNVSGLPLRFFPLFLQNGRNESHRVGRNVNT